MISGYNHFGGSSASITADHEHWMKYTYRNIDSAIRIIIATSSDLRCIICKNLSLNYASEGSLGRHYKWDHKTSIAKYYLKNFATKTPTELAEIIKVNTSNEILSEGLQ